MTSTLKKHTPRPPGGGDCCDSGYSNGTLPNSSAASIDTDDTGSSHCDSVPEFVNLTIVLPDGREQAITVESSKQMMDLLVQLTAANKLSPADHSLKVMSQRHQWMSTFKASQTIGSLRTDVVHLVSKKAEKEKKKRKPQQQQPFEMTQRLTVNLPHSQKMMMRISPQMTLAEIFQLICSEKNLDPYKYELRHPTSPNEALNMASPLNTYRLTAINIVNIAGDTSYPSSDSAIELPSSEDSDSNTMFRRKGSKEPPSEPEPFMPGMAAEKKKKGFFSFFRKKGSAKFKPGKASYPESQPSLPVSENNRPRPTSMFATLPLTRTSSSSSHNAPGGPSSAATLQKSQSVRSEPPAKPPRKKRHAPPPPVAASNRQNAINQSLPNIEEAATKEISVDVSTAVAHSRHSSHSSGFNETTSSPLESPGNSSHDSAAHVVVAPEADTQAKTDPNSGESLEVKDNLPSQDLTSEVSHPPSEAPIENTEQESSSNKIPDGDVESATLHRKRKAPAPPPVVDAADEQQMVPPDTSELPPITTEGGKEVDEDTKESTDTTTLVEALQMESISLDMTDSTPASPSRETTNSPLGGSCVVEDADLKVALVEELRNVDSQSPPEGSTSTTERRQLRLAEFHAPPPPDTPPPPETPSDCPSQGYPQSEDDGVRDRGGVDEAVQVQRSPLGSPREGDDHRDSVTEDMSPKSVVTATEDETTMTSQTSDTDFKNTSDVASFIEQISQFADEPAAPSSGNTADEAETLPLSADCVDATSLRDKTTTLPLTDGVEQDVTSCQVKSSAPSIHEEFSAIAEVTMPTEVLHQRNKDSHMEVTVTTESVDRTRDDDHENVSMATEDVQQIPEEVSMAIENDTETQVVLDETARNSLSEEACPIEDLGLPAVVYKVPVKAVNNRNKQSSAVTKEPTTQLCTSVPDEGRAETTTDKTPDELYTFSVTTEYVIKDNVLPAKEQPSPSKDQPSPSKDQPAPSTPEATVKDDATLFKVPSVPRMKQTPRVNSLREVYRKPILNNTYLGDSTGHVNSVARELIPPPLSAASRETAGKSNRDVGRKSSYDSIAKFTGPQPWGSRYQSEPSVKDIRKALLIRRESSLTRDMSSPGDRSSVVQESPSRNSSFSSSSEINFQPNSADESQSVLEEKSISMIALSSERKSTPRKTSTWSDRRRYSSMVSLATQNEPTLSLLPSRTMQNSSSMEQLAMTPNSRDKARRTLQSQYSELQMQFSKWQQQLMTNQALLTQKNLLRKSDRPRDTSVERDGYRRTTSRAAAEKRRSFIDERPASDKKDVRRVTSGVASEKRRSLIDDRPAMQDTTQEIREGTVEDLTSLGCQEPREGTAASSGDRVMRLSTGSRDTGLGGKFTPGELSTAKRVLRQNSNEVQGSTTVFKAVSQSNSPAQAAPPAWRSGSPIQRVTSPVRQSRSPTRQSRSQGRWSGSPARRMGSPTQRTGSPPPGILLTRETPPAQEVSLTQVTKAASSTLVTKTASSTQVTKTASSTQVTKAASSTQVTKTASSTQVTKTASSRSREVNRKRFEPKLDPREELMIAIRNAGAKNILKKAATTDDK